MLYYTVERCIGTGLKNMQAEFVERRALKGLSNRFDNDVTQWQRIYSLVG